MINARWQTLAVCEKLEKRLPEHVFVNWLATAAPLNREEIIQRLGMREPEIIIRRSRLEMTRAYAETQNCRRKYLLNYFGESRQEPCDYCDNCKVMEEAGSQTKEDGLRPYTLNSRVSHKSWGGWATKAIRLSSCLTE